MWEELLGVTRIGVKDDFFVLGGHSLLAVRLINKIKKLHGITLSLGDLFGAPTIEGIAGMLRRQTPSATVSVLVGIQPKGSKQPFFCVHPLSGFAACYYELASYMKKDQPFYGLQAPSLDGRQKPFSTIEEMAAYYVKEIREFQRDGPYLLGGWSMGGTVAFEMAQQLKRQNQEVALLALLDNGKMSSRKPSNISDTDWLIEICADMNVFLPSDHLRKLSIDEQLDYATHQVEAAGLIPEGGRRDIFRQYFYSTKAHSRATESYCPQPYPGWIDIFRTEWRGERDDDPDLDWKTLAPGGFQIHKISGTHQSIMRAPHVQELADRLIDCLDQAHSRIDTCFMNMN
jgi:thioesterase domain-containing protein